MSSVFDRLRRCRHALQRALAVLLMLSASVTAHAAMEAIPDDQLTLFTAQAGSLFVSDRIGPNELQRHGNAAYPEYTNFTYYRMGMDVKLEMNANISKLQLGCGGVNDLLVSSPGCDLDIDYVRLMGINAAGDRPATDGAASSFSITRPYVELAVKNDGTAQREIVGFKLGGQKINGALGLGRDYTGYGGYGQESNLTNQENWLPSAYSYPTAAGGPATSGVCDPNATTGWRVVNCHSGVNSLSGFLAGIELSSEFQASANVCLFLCVNTNIDGCLGRINSGAGCSTGDTPFFVDAGGTRLDTLFVKAAPLTLKAIGISGLEGYGGLMIGMRQIHFLTTPNVSDFFISFQRERVSWPRYEKTPPPNNVQYDSCNPGYGQTTPRCNSAYTVATNTGWWLNATGVKMMNLRPSDRINLPGSLTVGQLLNALGPDSSPIVIYDPKLDFIAQRNCYGAALFC